MCCPLSGAFGIPYNYFGSSTPSYQFARTGNAYSFVSAYDTQYVYLSKLYIQVPLSDSLLKNKKYYCEFFVSLVDRHKYGSNNVGMLLTKNAVYVDTLQDPRLVINANPQILNYNNLPITDTQNWVKISGVFKAQGGEKFITLGNFKDNLHNTIALANNSPLTCICASYFIDDVSVIPLDSFNLKADAGRDTTINIGDSAFIGSLTNGIDSLKWFNGLMVIDSTRPGFWVHPTASTCYVLTQTVNGFTSSDTVCVTVGTVPLKITNFELRIISEPSLRGTKQSVENVFTTANEINVSHFNIQRSTNGKDFITVGKVAANNKQQNNYTYIDEQLPLTTDQLTIYYRLQAVDNDGRKNYSTTQQIRLNELTNKPINVYPNPSKDFVTIECKDGIKQLLIIDYLGRIVYQSPVDRRLTTVNTKQTMTLNLKQLNKGVYVMQVITKNGDVRNEKLIIE